MMSSKHLMLLYAGQLAHCPTPATQLCRAVFNLNMSAHFSTSVWEESEEVRCTVPVMRKFSEGAGFGLKLLAWGRL